MHVLLMLTGSPHVGQRRARRQLRADPSLQTSPTSSTAAAKRYPAIHHWMILGEPTRGPELGALGGAVREGARPPADDQTAAGLRTATRAFSTPATAALKAASSTNLVIGGNTYTTGDIPPVASLHNLKLPNGKPPRMDLYGHNPFSYRPPVAEEQTSRDAGTVDFSDLGRFQKVDRPPAWGTRATSGSGSSCRSSPSRPTSPNAEFNFHVTRALQAKWIDRRVQGRAPGPRLRARLDPPLRRSRPTPHGGAVKCRTGLIDGQGRQEARLLRVQARLSYRAR